MNMYIVICACLLIVSFSDSSRENLLDAALSEMERDSIYDTRRLRVEAYKFLGCQYSTSSQANQWCIQKYAAEHNMTFRMASQAAFIAAAKAVGDKWAQPPLTNLSKEVVTKQLNTDIVLFRFRHFQPTVNADLKKLSQYPKPEIVIIDLYDNLGGGYNTVADTMTEAFIRRGLVSYRMYKNGRMEVEAAARRTAWLWTKDPAVEVRILISHKTVSNGEYVPRILKLLRPNVCIIGNPTHGKGVFQSMGKLAYFTVGWQLLPDGTTFDGQPLQPDVYAASYEEALTIAQSPVACPKQ